MAVAVSEKRARWSYANVIICFSNWLSSVVQTTRQESEVLMRLAHIRLDPSRLWWRSPEDVHLLPFRERVGLEDARCSTFGDDFDFATYDLILVCLQHFVR